MSYEPPAWMNAEDREREERMVQAMRDVVKQARALAERVNTAQQLNGWRWRVELVTGEARAHARALEAAPTPAPEPEPTERAA